MAPQQRYHIAPTRVTRKRYLSHRVTSVTGDRTCNIWAAGRAYYHQTASDMREGGDNKENRRNGQVKVGCVRRKLRLAVRHVLGCGGGEKRRWRSERDGRPGFPMTPAVSHHSVGHQPGRHVTVIASHLSTQASQSRDEFSLW
ncbi:hypothetical protein E2C01_054145 [Portunus trituberculatus]|uniref:Uncharacterized protein n=1 Tax=Portunus trituberculatus TaxID=210409 RepID=A0A5B7GSX7_PORTR|nr:hypothetical protein [Portunus trituberculatus]